MRVPALVCVFGAGVWQQRVPCAPATPSRALQVPVLEDGPFVLTESLHCADYVAAVAAERGLPSTLPRTPADRARTGLFLELIPRVMNPLCVITPR